MSLEPILEKINNVNFGGTGCSSNEEQKEAESVKAGEKLRVSIWSHWAAMSALWGGYAF